MHTAVIIGATGLVGSHVLQILLEDTHYERVISLGRSSTGVNHSKYQEFIVDLFKTDTYETYLNSDQHVYICTGTTAAKTPDDKQYYRIEHDMPVVFSACAKIKAVRQLAVISALGADHKSRLSYNRYKGEMERDILDLNIENTYIVRPALIAGDREEWRLGEYVWKKIQSVINPLLVGKFKKYRSIHPKTIAQAMVQLQLTTPAQQIYESDELVVYAQQYE